MPAPIHLQLARQIVETLKSICDHDINYIDLRGRICASTDPARVDDHHSGGFEAARTGETIVIAQDDPRSGDRRGINMPIRYKGEVVAVIGITGDPEEVRRYADLAQRITILLLREQDLDLHDRAGKAQVQYVLRSIMRGETVHPAVLEDVLASRGIPSSRGSWRTAVILPDVEDLASLSLLEQELLQVFEQIGKCLFLSRFPEEYVLTAPSSQIEEHLPLLRSLAQRRASQLRIGIGAAGKLAQQSHSRETARIAAASLRAGDSTAPLIRYDDLDLEILLASVPAADREAYLQKTLAGLSQEDLDLLRVYYDCGQSLQEASRALFLHKNTLQYKLNRIHGRCGYDPRAFRDAVVLYAALRLQDHQRTSVSLQYS